MFYISHFNYYIEKNQYNPLPVSDFLFAELLSLPKEILGDGIKSPYLRCLLVISILSPLGPETSTPNPGQKRIRLIDIAGLVDIAPSKLLPSLRTSGEH